MKKIIAFILATIILVSMSACGAKTEPAVDSGANNDTVVETEENPENNDNVAESETNSETGNGSIEVDENLLTVEVTLGSNFFEDETPEEIKSNAIENGFIDCTIGDDGSVTYKMTKIKHREILEDLKANLEESIAELLNGEDAVDSFISIDHNDNFSQIDVFVDPETYSAFDCMYALAFYVSGVYYQSFAGVDADLIDVVVNFIDNNTKEVLDTASYKSYMENNS